MATRGAGVFLRPRPVQSATIGYLTLTTAPLERGIGEWLGTDTILNELTSAGLHTVESIVEDQGLSKPYMLRVICKTPN